MESLLVFSNEISKSATSPASKATSVVDLLGSIPDSVTHASDVLKPTSILKPSQRDNRTVVAHARRKVTFKSADSPNERWRSIRDLDEAENWSERTSVVTKADHTVLLAIGRELVENLVSDLPCFRTENSMDEKDFIPAGVAREEFRAVDPRQFELDYLEKISSEANADPASIALARQSLYVKFDPLVKGAVTQGAGVQRTKKEDGNLLSLDTPEKLAKKTPSPIPEVMSSSTPLVSAQSQEESLKSTSSLVQSSGSQLHKNADLPLPPRMGVDQLLFQSPSPKHPDAGEKEEEKNSGGGLIDVLMYTGNDLERRVTEAVEELKKSHSLEHAQWQKESKQSKEELAKRTEELLKKTKECNELKKLSAKYKSTIKDLLVQQEESSKALLAAKEYKERSKAEFDSVETAFADLHKRYERVKGFHEGDVKGGEELKKALNEYKDRLSRSELKYKALKSQAEEKLASCSAEIEKVQKAKDSELAVLQAQLKKEQMKVTRLEKDLTSKDHDLKELSSICDDLMKQLGEKQG